MQPEEPRPPTSARTRHERFGLLERGEKQLREPTRGRQVSEAVALARHRSTKLVDVEHSTTPVSIADHLR